MEEKTVYTAYPKVYINTVPSLIIVIVKCIEGLIAVAALYHIFSTLGILFAELSKGAASISDAIRILSSDNVSPLSSFGTTIGYMLDGITLPVLIWGGTLLLVIAFLLMVIMEAAAALCLRISYKGAGIIRGIHLVYMGICLLMICLSIYPLLIAGSGKNHLIDDELIAAGSMTYTLLLIFAVAVLLVLACYHKDIAMAMGTINEEIKTTELGRLKRTHLSGLSFLIALPFFLISISYLLGMLRTGISGIRTGEERSMLQIILTISIPVIITTKYLCVCLCNRRLKIIHQQMEQSLERLNTV